MLSVLFSTVSVVFAIILPISNSLGCCLLTIVLYHIQSTYHSVELFYLLGSLLFHLPPSSWEARIAVLMYHASPAAWNSAGT